jgi:tRNA modification GTPase
MDNETIAAIATPFGEGAVGIVRLSGSAAIAIVDKIFSAKNKKPLATQKSFSLRYGWIVGSGGEVIDEVVVSLMRAPKSYTREDVVEINSHGGPCALSGILALVCENGARLSQPGEFTKRAFLNGRLDLAQAEAVLDIIQAKSSLALKSGLSQLSGEVSRCISELRVSLLNVLADMEASIDFSEEDAGAGDTEALCGRITDISSRLQLLLKRAFEGRIIREGLKVVIYGRPNVGKSSLLNVLLKQDRAIVTSIAGTTRDTIEELISIKGLAVRLIDTAGMLEHRDDIEKEALARTKRALESCDLILFVLDGSMPVTGDDKELAAQIAGRKKLVVVNKCDLGQGIDTGEVERLFSQKPICVSARIGVHIAELEDLIYKSVFQERSEASEGAMVSNARHIEILKAAHRSLETARESIAAGLSLEFGALDVKKALDTLGSLTGEVFSEELLDTIFSKFCIGK